MALVHTKKHGSIYIDVVKVVNHYEARGMLDKLRIQNDGNAGACCPSSGHDDSSPSWGINLLTGIHQCYSCGWAGDVVTFCREIETIIARGKDFGFLSTIEKLLRISMDDEETGVIDASHVVRHRALDDNRDFQVYPESLLEGWKDDYSYLLRRGVSENVCKAWQVKYDPEESRRYIIPVRDIRNRMVGFLGVADDKMREQNADNKSFLKVLNSPKLWKSRILLGIHRYELCNRKWVIVVEGPIDCLKVSSGVGPKMMVVSCLGSDFSAAHAKLLKDIGYTKIIVLADNDDPQDYLKPDGSLPDETPGQKMIRKVRKEFAGEPVDIIVPEYDAPDPGAMELDQVASVVRGVLTG